jgi:cytochrome P450
LPVDEAARRAGISAETWGNVERGYRTTGKGKPAVPVEATPTTLAHMAHAVGLEPEDLERLGRENASEAAEILREMYGGNLEAMEVEVGRGTMLLAVPPGLSDEDREHVRRQAEELAKYLDQRSQEGAP